MDQYKQGIHSGRVGTYRPHMETGSMEEGRQRNKNRNAKPTPTDNTQNSVGQINEDNVQKNW